jgi:hypothetical protein
MVLAGSAAAIATKLLLPLGGCLTSENLASSSCKGILVVCIVLAIGRAESRQRARWRAPRRATSPFANSRSFRRRFAANMWSDPASGRPAAGTHDGLHALMRPICTDQVHLFHSSFVRTQRGFPTRAVRISQGRSSLSWKICWRTQEESKSEEYNFTGSLS